MAAKAENMAKSMINFKALKSNSEHHNFRQGEKGSLDYIFDDLTKTMNPGLFHLSMKRPKK